MYPLLSDFFLVSARAIGTSEAINTSKYGGKQNHKTPNVTTETPTNTLIFMNQGVLLKHPEGLIGLNSPVKASCTRMI